MTRRIDITVDPLAPEDAELARAAQLLRDGKLVAFPTETVYGLGANATDAAAVAGIFAAKGRPSTNPLIVHVASVELARGLVDGWPASAQALAEAFWPGPLTLVLPKNPEVIPDTVTAGGPTVAVRMPAHPVAQRLIELAGVPICAPSANRSTEVSPTRAEHVRAGLGDRIDALIDGGATDVGVESTVLTLVEDPPRILRPGMIGAQAIKEVLGRALADAPEEVIDTAHTAPSPGMSKKHYSPRARVMLVEEVPDDLGEDGAIVLEGAASERVVVLGAAPRGYARGLYAALHRLDALSCPTIWVEMPPQTPAWRAIHDRLRRAAAE